MQKHDRNQLIEYDNERFRPKVLLNEPGYRVVLLSMRAGQSIPEHTVQGIITVYAILGQVSFYAGSCPCDLHAGKLVCIESGLPHRVEAQQDSALLLLITDGESSLPGRLRRTRPARDPASGTPPSGISQIRHAGGWKVVHADERS